MSGWTVDRRDQVRSTFFSLRLFMSSILDRRWPSTNAPFFVLLAISQFSALVVSSRWLLSVLTLLASPLHDEFIGALVVACLVSTGGLAPGRYRMASATGFALAATVRMVHRVHGHAAVGRTNSKPARASRLAYGNVFVVHVAHLTDGGHAIHQHSAGFTRRQFD